MKILVISDDKVAKDRLLGILGEESRGHDIGLVETKALSTPEDLAYGAMDLLVVEGLGANDTEWHALERLSAMRPQLPIVVSTNDQSAEVLRLAMRSGVREVVPQDESNVRDMFMRMFERIAASSGHAPGKVISFIPAKGSSGATFLATSLGYSLSSRSEKKVLLVDLNLECGDAALFVNEKEPEFTLADICKQIQRLDASLLSACSATRHANFSVLAAPGDPEAALTVKPEHIDQIVHVAKEQYDFVILDIDRKLDAVAIHALDLSDTVFTVIQETLPYVRDAKRLLKTYASLGYSTEKLKILVNRHHKGLDISVADIERTLELPISKEIPNSYKSVVSSINQGIPLSILNPRDPVVKAVDEIADSIGGRPKQSGSWLDRIFHG